MSPWSIWRGLFYSPKSSFITTFFNCSLFFIISGYFAILVTFLYASWDTSFINTSFSCKAWIWLVLKTSSSSSVPKQQMQTPGLSSSCGVVPRWESKISAPRSPFCKTPPWPEDTALLWCSVCCVCTPAFPGVYLTKPGQGARWGSGGESGVLQLRCFSFGEEAGRCLSAVLATA